MESNRKVWKVSTCKIYTVVLFVDSENKLHKMVFERIVISERKKLTANAGRSMVFVNKGDEYTDLSTFCWVKNEVNYTQK